MPKKTKASQPVLQKKRTRPVKTEFERTLERVIKIGKAHGVHAIQTKDFIVTITPRPVVTPPEATTPDSASAPLKGKPIENHKVTAGGILIDNDVPKEQILSDEDFLMMSTPFFQMNKPLMNGDEENQ